ncbi:hypothetical protein EDD37DRAFT_646474 [Exophiala viscosa]|uniref:uncharacterized protein n=1 Tax=Exophiala viscosa TaxID=2486360 RepID=UPI00219CE57C|nr:hypothetical protein EDD37DRAFT_646474 [Exophiala viscosa]
MAGDNIFWSNFFRKLREWWYAGQQAPRTISFPLDASYGISKPLIFESPSWTEEFLAYLTTPRVGIISASSQNDGIALNIHVALSTSLKRSVITDNDSSPLLQFGKVAAPLVNASKTIPVQFDEQPKNTAASTTDLAIYTSLPVTDAEPDYSCNWHSQVTGTWQDHLTYYVQSGRIPVAGCTYRDGSYGYHFDSSMAQTWALTLVMLFVFLFLGFSCCTGSNARRPRQHHAAPPANDSPEVNLIINGLVEDLMTGRLGEQMVELGLIEQSNGDSTRNTASDAAGFTTFNKVLRKLMAFVSLLRIRLALRTDEVKELKKVNNDQRTAHTQEIQQKDNDIAAKEKTIQAKDNKILEKENEKAFQEQMVRSKTSRVLTLEQEIFEKDNAIAPKDTELQQKNGDIAAKQDLITTKDKELQQKDEDIAAKQDSITSKDSTISEMEKSLKVIEEKASTLENQNEQLRQRLKQHEGTPALRERHEELQKSHKELQAKEQSLRTQLENQPDPDEQLKTDNEKLVKEKEKLQERMKVKAEALQKAQAELEKKETPKQQKSIETQTEIDTAHDEKVEQLKSEISQTLSTLNQMRTENSELQSTISNLRTQTTELSQVNSMNAELQSTVDSLRAQLAAAAQTAQTTQPAARVTPSTPSFSIFAPGAQSHFPIRPPFTYPASGAPTSPAPAQPVTPQARPAASSPFKNSLSTSEPEQNFTQTRTPVEAVAPVAAAPAQSSQAVFPEEQAPEFTQTIGELPTGRSTGPIVRMSPALDSSRGRTPAESSLMRSRNSIRYSSPPRNASGIPTRPLTQREREAKKQRDAERAAATAASSLSRGSTVSSNEVQQGQQQQAPVAETAVNEPVAPVAPSASNVVVALPPVTAPEVSTTVNEDVTVNKESELAASSGIEDDLEFAPGGFGEEDDGGIAGMTRQEPIEVESDDLYGAPETTSGSSVGQSANETQTTTPVEQPVDNDAEQAARKAKAAEKGEKGLQAVKASKWAAVEETPAQTTPQQQRVDSAAIKADQKGNTAKDSSEAVKAIEGKPALVEDKTKAVNESKPPVKEEAKPTTTQQRPPDSGAHKAAKETKAKAGEIGTKAANESKPPVREESTPTTRQEQQPVDNSAARATQQAKKAEAGKKAVQSSKWAVNPTPAPKPTTKQIEEGKWDLVEDEKKADEMGKAAVQASRWAVPANTPVTRVRAARHTPQTPTPRALDHGLPRLNATQDQPGTEWTPVGGKKPLHKSNQKGGK